ncbi:type I-U CRISPR-associated protein Cas5/Cas6 [bacterium]|nr:type I-U CRISPR-associated protein Cas5/Cas6 [bacterium]
MPLTLSLQFPAGRYVAASWGDKDQVEWPPHPARLCLALIDALHKSGNAPGPRAALQWLCQQAPPELVIPAVAQADVQVLDGIYVPQNPAQTEAVKHPRKPRSFPSVFLDADVPTVFFHYPAAALPESLRENLASLVSNLPRFGHSSSLVIVSISEEAPPSGGEWRVIRPMNDDHHGSPEFRLRVGWDGLLESAEEAFDAAGRADEMTKLIATAHRTAKPDKTLKPAASPRGRHDPKHRWHGYVERSVDAAHGAPWDKRILVLKQTGGDRLGLASTWQLAQVFHKTLLDRWCRHETAGPPPPWLSGHQAGEAGSPTGPAVDTHLAVFPLAFVGSEHATGNLMGLGLALPRPERIGVDAATFRIQWRQALASVLDENGQLELSPPDKAWTLRLAPEESPDPRQALRPARWTEASAIWTTVTPIILDRHPKPHFNKDPEAWRASCIAIIGDACERIGLPRPLEIDVSRYSPLAGVPAASGFVAPAPRPGRPPRFHVHASLKFAEPVEGPLLLGAGRYRGYGLCLPITANSRNHSQ